METAPGHEALDNKRPRFSVLPRACEACRTRKIRCDRQIPCANCQISGIACQKAETPEKRPKVDQKAILEQHVKALESRLKSLEKQLASPQNASTSSATSLPSTDSPGHTSITNYSRDTNNQKVPVSNVLTPMYEGPSSFSSQSVQARETAETMADPNDPKSSLNVTLRSLETLLKPATESDSSFKMNTKASTQIALPLPAEVVVAMLRRFDEKTPTFFSSYFVNNVSFVERLCQRVYFPIRPVCTGTVTAMHGILYFLLKETITTKDQICEELNLEQYLEGCKKSFEAGLEDYNVITIPSYENTLALTIGVIKAQDDSSPLMCCHLVSTASRHCQMLGYHRESTYKEGDSNANDKRRLFWTLYAYDKSMSLLLGRASYIQDFDIDVKLPPKNVVPKQRPWDESFIEMIKMAEIGGNVYNKLYSATASKASFSERASIIQDLKSSLEKCRERRYKIDYSIVEQHSLFKASEKAFDIVHWSTMTSLLRASSTSTKGGEIGPECFEAARTALQSLLQIFPDFSTLDVLTIENYVNWFLQYSSFTPFIVIFLHAIAATSLEDVKLLEEVAGTLFHARGVSSASERMYSIGTNFARAARGLVEAQKSCVGAYNKQRDSLQLHNEPRINPATHSDALVDPLADSDMMNYISYPEAQDMSILFETWDCGQPSAMDIFGIGVNQPG